MQAAEEERLKEEQAQREHEEYLKLKEAFTVDEEGTDALEQQDVCMDVNVLVITVQHCSPQFYIVSFTQTYAHIPQGAHATWTVLESSGFTPPPNFPYPRSPGIADEDP